jgi:hypothetical protein
MTWNTIKERLKSPVVIVEIIFILGGAAVLAWPGLADGWKIAAGVLASLMSVFAATNDPTNPVGY